MDPLYRNKKINDLSEEEAKTLAFLGPYVCAGVRDMSDVARADPTGLGTVTCFVLDCINRKYAPPTTLQDAPRSSTQRGCTPETPAEQGRETPTA
ncbi:unnamed protein product [Peniophora sp. CBMAI 1063]|nr:unnamed protein product [Peniophora sp. CBMAI 1063]